MATANNTPDLEPLSPTNSFRRNIRPDVIRLYTDMDHIRYLYNLVGDPVGNLIVVARNPFMSNNEIICYPHLFQHLVEAADEADDMAADDIGIRDTLYTILLDHGHHARDRR